LNFTYRCDRYVQRAGAVALKVDEFNRFLEGNNDVPAKAKRKNQTIKEGMQWQEKAHSINWIGFAPPEYTSPTTWKSAMPSN
jgi:hypothetical protein